MNVSVVLMHNKRPPLRRLAALVGAAALVLSGCAALPPESAVLPQQDLARAQLAGDIKLAREGWPAAQWWTQYGDAQLDVLEHQALAASPTLAVAASRIGAARSALAFDKADAGLNVSLDASANRQRYSGNGLFPAPIGGSWYTEETVQAQATYQFDWWGKHRAQIAGALGEVNASRADYAMAEQTLAAEVATSYFTLQNGGARLANLQRLAGLMQQMVDDKAKRVAHGLAPIDQQYSAAAQLSYVEQLTAQLQSRLKREREALRALVGADAGALEALQTLHPAPLQETGYGLPATLGMELLARRPDLQAARWRVEASLSRIEAAQAAFYPDVDLTGSFGLDAVKLSHLLQSGSRTLFVGPTLSLPLFDSHRLDARLDAARSERNELIADYNQTVFNVVRDVAQAGVDLQGVAQQMTHQRATLAATEALQHSASARMDRGLADHATVLTYDSAVLVQVDAGLQLQGQQLLAEVALVRALGGGYHVDPHAPAPAPAASTSAAVASAAAPAPAVSQ